jgi:hypothetical protein
MDGYVFQYTINSDESFLNKTVDIDAFTAQIRASSITVALDTVVINGPNCAITFKNALSTDEQTTLFDLVRAHDGKALPSNITVNFPADKQQVNALNVSIVGKYGDEALFVTHNYCARESWFQQSVRVTGEVASNPSNDKITYVLANSNIIDVTHGKLYNEDIIAQTVNHGYTVAVVKDGSSVLTERECFEETGGDYTLDYKNGFLNLFVPATNTVTVDYSHENGSEWSIQPEPGTFLELHDAKLIYSQDAYFMDTVVYRIDGYAGVFAPDLVAANVLQATDQIPIQTVYYKSLTQLLYEAESFGNTLPPSDNPRGFPLPMCSANFKFDPIRKLSSAAGMRLTLSLKHNRNFMGTQCAVAFNCAIGHNTADNY